MPSLRCLGCNDQKRSKNAKYYSVNSLSLITINNLRQTFNTKKRQLDKITEIPPSGKICKSCYDLQHNNVVVSVDLSKPDISIYRKGLHSHTQCMFGCKNVGTVGTLLSVPRKTRGFLLMNYKFLIIETSHMCREHVGLDNYWPLVNQITREVTAEDQKLVSDLMFKYHHEMRNEHTFNIDNLDSIDDNDFHAWFGFAKDQFRTICNYIDSCEAKHVAVLLCKLRTSLSNKQL